VAAVDVKAEGRFRRASGCALARLIGISLVVSLLALVLPAGAQATFQSLGRLSPSQQEGKEPQVAVDSNGKAVFAWTHFDGTDATKHCCYRIEAQTRTSTGTLGPLLTLSAAKQTASQPQVAVDPNGNAYFTWVINNGTNTLVQARKLSSSGTLGIVQTLSAPGQNADEPQVAVDPNGNAVFVWSRFDGSNGTTCCFRIQTRRLTATGTLSVVQTLSNAGQTAFSPQVGVDANGNAVYDWAAFTGSRDDIQARARTASGTLSALQTVSSGTKEASQPQIAVSSNGSAAFTWVESATFDLVMGRARSSTGTLSAIQTLSATGQFAEEPQVGIDGSGNAVFVWERFDSSNGTVCCWRIEARPRTSGGTLGTTQLLSAAGQSALSPQVSVDPNGNAAIVWGRNDGTKTNCCSLIQTTRRTSSGTLSAVQTLSATGQNASEPQVAIDVNSNAVYTWSRFDGKYTRVQARRRASTGTLSTTQTLSSVGPDATKPQVAVDPNANSVFTWVASDGFHTFIQARARSSAGVLSLVQTLSDTSQNASQPQVGVDASGNAVFVWKRSDGTNDRIEAITRTAAGVLGSVQVLSAAGQNADAPDVAVDPNGNAVFTWTRSDGTNVRVEAIARSSTGTLSAVQTLSPAGQNASEPHVGIDSGGNAVFTWTRSDGTNTRIEGIARSSSGTLSSVQLLSLAGQNASAPQVAVDSSGNAVFTWKRFDGTNDRTETRTRSSTGTLTPVQPLSAPGQNASQPQVAVTGSGNAVYTWTRFDGTTPGTCCFRVQTRTRSSTGTMTPVQILSPAGDNSGLPQVGVDSSGNAVYVWRFDGTNKRTEARTRSSTGTLGAVQFLSIAGFDADAPQVGVAATNGKALAAWQLFDGKKSRVEGAAGP
jgi:hypothetical protein